MYVIFQRQMIGNFFHRNSFGLLVSVVLGKQNYIIVLVMSYKWQNVDMTYIDFYVQRR